MRFVEHITL